MPMLTTSVIAAALPRDAAVADGGGEGLHPRERVADAGHDVAAVDHDGAAVEVAERGVEDRAALRLVDLLRREHGVASWRRRPPRRACAISRSRVSASRLVFE